MCYPKLIRIDSPIQTKWETAISIFIATWIIEPPDLFSTKKAGSNISSQIKQTYSKIDDIKETTVD